jgi:UDP-N-acetylglucosamine 4,6-dehydratase/5-epimerase
MSQKTEGIKRNYLDELSDKTLLITGGTGSFGKTIAKSLLDSNIREIRIFSRDEKKQDDLRKKYSSQKLKFYIGDIREYDSIYTATQNVDYVFHAAALKQVPSCEFFPMEAYKTNVQGTDNLLKASIENSVQKVVCLSTDKAVYPINAMGISKAMMEKIMVAKSRQVSSSGTVICATRYGNVMASRGSVIPLFLEQVANESPITITDPKMTRFMMSLDDAVELVLYAFSNARNGDLFVQKAPAASIGALVTSIKELLNLKNYPTSIIGTRHGEKLYESLLSREEYSKAEDLGKYYRVSSDDRDLNYENYISTGENLNKLQDYNSHNTKQLSVSEMKKLLKSLNLLSGLK